MKLVHDRWYPKPNYRRGEKFYGRQFERVFKADPSRSALWLWWDAMSPAERRAVVGTILACVFLAGLIVTL